MTATPMTTTTAATKSSNSQRTSIAAGTPTLSKTETVFCGASAGVVSRFVIAPLDVVKIRLQMQTQRKDFPTILRLKAEASGAPVSEGAANTAARQLQQFQPKYKGMFSGMAMIVREEGVRGLWKGNMAAEYLYLTYSGIQFLVYQQTKILLAKTAEISAHKATMARTSSATVTATSGSLHALSVITSSSALQSFIAGANAGIVATACTYPFDLLRTRFAIQRDVKVYTGIVQASRHIFNSEGMRGFYKGMSPALIQVIPYMGIMFGTYDTLKRVASWLKDKANVESSYSKRTITAPSKPPTTAESGVSSSEISSEKLPAKRTAGQFLLGLEDLVCGALSGTISKTGVYPLDMVRKRLQIQGSEQQRITASVYSPQSVTKTAATSGSKAAVEELPTTVRGCLVHIARKEGYLALYKGLLPGLLKAAPSSAVTFLVFSQAGAFVEKMRRPKPVSSNS
ncbi:mitochondrial thiamine pyrophosphate transporter [Mortierella polycephala]|uniref:Mitochondrial thiamine pyrophosphate transporter n=1 Tax=Mortierella polycephala TaxID=41804 RepID=A0A9P6Q5Z2_9FUNG|nr:mitochondrial thiamine pyrophosphate transporter [Mortierella polycephala]